MAGSGCPLDDDRELLCISIRQNIMDDNGITIREIAEEYDIDKTMVWRILKRDLNMRSVSSKWIPHELTDQHKILK